MYPESQASFAFLSGAAFDRARTKGPTHMGWRAFKGASLGEFADTSHRRATVRHALPNTMSDKHGKPQGCNCLGVQLYNSEELLEY